MDNKNNINKEELLNFKEELELYNVDGTHMTEEHLKLLENIYEQAKMHEMNNGFHPGDLPDIEGNKLTK